MVKLKPTFVKTKNVRNFEVMLGGLDMNNGEGCLAIVYGRAGRGKSRTTHWHCANKGDVYVRMAKIWKHSELDFLKTLCQEVGVLNPPSRKGAAYKTVIDALIEQPVRVFLDEIEKLPPDFLEIVRDMSDVSACPFVLIGEEELVTCMKRNRRVWSRTFQSLEFAAIEPVDVLSFAFEAGGLRFDAPAAVELCNTSGGDFRLVKRDLLKTMQFAWAKKIENIGVEDVKLAVKAGLRGA